VVIGLILKKQFSPHYLFFIEGNGLRGIIAARSGPRERRFNDRAFLTTGKPLRNEKIEKIFHLKDFESFPVSCLMSFKTGFF
jgi:hypothetical protein